MIQNRSLTLLLGLALALSLSLSCKEETSEPKATSKSEMRGRFKIVWLKGTPYEMGYQHGQELHDELEEALAFIEGDPLFSTMVSTATSMGITDLAYENSYPDILEECRGLTDALKDIGFSMDQCLLLNYGDVLMEFILDGMPETKQACSQMAVTGPATTDGRLYHGRILDWSKINYILNNPTIFVRQPNDGLAHAYIGFPGNLSPYSGINEAGISVCSNEAHPFDNSFHDRKGRSHVQMLGQILKRTSSLEEAKELIMNEDHMSVEIFMVADGNTRQAAVFEMSSKVVGVREIDENGVLYVTNHFLAEKSQHADQEPTKDANLLRYDRLGQYLEPDGEASLWGTLAPQGLITIMRDRINPWTKEESSIDVFDNGLSLATYGALYEIVFDPEKRFFWVAAGELPVPQQPFIGFSLSELLGTDDAKPVTPELYP